MNPFSQPIRFIGSEELPRLRRDRAFAVRAAAVLTDDLRRIPGLAEQMDRMSLVEAVGFLLHLPETAPLAAPIFAAVVLWGLEWPDLPRVTS